MARKRKKLTKKQRRRQIIRRVTLFMVFFLLIAFAAGTFVYLKKTVDVQITVRLKEMEMLQDEEIPKPEWEVSVNEEWYKKLPLNWKEKYKVGDLLKELKAGKYQTVTMNPDTTYEDEYPVKVSLRKSFKEIENQFGWKINASVSDTTITVKNKVGEWDGKKFKRWDGTYVKNKFVTYQKKVYYFKKNGKMAVGKTKVGDDYYFFDKKGVRKTGWKDLDGEKYYFGKDGKMLTGWQEFEGNTYYLSADIGMYTGQHWIGMQKCVFSQDGALISAEYSVNPDAPMIALTFDDGPGQYTKKLLRVLKKNHAHATFFMVGPNVGYHPSDVQKMLEIGCELGNHTWSHAQLTTLDEETIKKEIDDTNQALIDACGQKATVLRPPYGSYNDDVLKVAKMPAVLWSVDTLDWKTKSKKETVKAILEAQDGDIILLHDIHEWSVKAAIKAIPKLIDKGYQLVTVSEMAAARNGGMAAGQHYSQFWP